MTQRKVLEFAMIRARELWIIADEKASEVFYNDPELNRLEVKHWDEYQECCGLYFAHIKTLREQRRMYHGNND